MIVYRGTKAQYLALGDGQELAAKIARCMHRTPDPGSSEFGSWQESFGPVSRVLKDSRIPDDLGVGIEYGLKVGNFRIDYLFTGRDKTGREKGVIVELKQWSAKSVVLSTADRLVRVKGERGGDKVHPSYQALSYQMMLKNYNANVQDEQIQLSPCAFLFNYKPVEGKDVLRSPAFVELLRQSPLYDWDSWRNLQRFLIDELPLGDPLGRVILDIESGEIRPSKALQDAVGDMLEGNEVFTLVDSQKVVFEKACALVRDGVRTGKRRVYLVHGGPGTGKSVIAVNLMARLLCEGIPSKELRSAVVRVPKNLAGVISGRENHLALYCPYVTKTSAPREVYESLLVRHSSSGKKWNKAMVQGLFVGSGKFKKPYDEPVYAGLVIDEAHRLKENDRFNADGNYLESVLTAAYTAVCFIDDRQQVTSEDYGSSSAIRALCGRHAIEVVEDTLTTEFRCTGGDGYIGWLDTFLYGGDLASLPSFHSSDFEVKVFDEPEAMHEAIRKKDREHYDLPCRVSAGYCWDWVSKRSPSTPDIVIGSYKRFWNIPGSEPFAIGSRSVDEVGSIHTVQGLEFAYSAVIIGPDLRLEDGRLVADPSKRAKTDASLHRHKGVSEADLRRLVLNTYRVLLTRGQKGCYVYAVDPALGAFLKTRLDPA